MIPRHRVSTRALILEPGGRFLLFLSHFAPGTDLPPQWVFPGGGLETDEKPLDGIAREVFEETGQKFPVEAFEPLTLIWHEMDDRRFHDSGEAHFFELRVSERFEPSNQHWTQEEHRDTVRHRWISIDELVQEKLWLGPQGAIDLLTEYFGDRQRQAPPDRGS